MQTRCMIERSEERRLPVVLLIDDDLVSREVAATMLTMAGFTVHTAESGVAALDMLDRELCRPGAILMDAQMPGLSGTTLIAELRKRTKVRIYAISGSDAPPDVAGAADGFLLKPFSAENLRKVIDGYKQEAPATLLDAKEPVVSAEVLSQLRKVMPESAVRQIYSAVVSDLTVRIQALGAAIAKGDAAEIRRIGHAIKGGCGMAGALQAARLGALLEATPLGAKDNQLDNSAILLNDLRAAAQGLERMLDAELPA
ncbi:MAG TPA: response regulator [Terracidiphilus sp.]|nr:response regulator [Terracidiphilus sp.]